MQNLRLEFEDPEIDLEAVTKDTHDPNEDANVLQLVFNALDLKKDEPTKTCDEEEKTQKPPKPRKVEKYDKDCMVCMTVMVQPTKLQCGHHLCIQCANNMLVRKNSNCPYCRAIM